MNWKAIVNGREYTLFETIVGLEENEKFVICTDSEGKRFVCSEEFWKTNEMVSESLAPVHRNSTTQEILDI